MPKLLVLVLNKPELQPEILRAFKRIGIKGATIIDSTGMGRAVAEQQQTPIVASLQRILDGGHHYNRTIFCVVEGDDVLQRAIEVADEIIDFAQPGSGIIFTMPVDLVRGMKDHRLQS